ncbi:MAG: hydrogenase maturation nickel metallochaperone HypA [Cyanobacteria bacterium J06639_1]
MHEVSVMESVSEIAIARAREVGAPHIHQLQLEVGEFSGVVVDALEFAFDVVVAGTMLEDAGLEYHLSSRLGENCCDRPHGIRSEAAAMPSTNGCDCRRFGNG